MKTIARKEPLFRKVNTTARGVRHGSGGDYRHDRNTKAVKTEMDVEADRRSMGKTTNRGLDYTPLYRFLLSKVGSDWTAVHREAVSRLDKEDPIYHIVARRPESKRDVVCCGETSYFSGLFVDDDNTLQRVNPKADHSAVHVYCPCCTYTFNGVTVPQKYEEPQLQSAPGPTD